MASAKLGASKGKQRAKKEPPKTYFEDQYPSKAEEAQRTYAHIDSLTYKRKSLGDAAEVSFEACNCTIDEDGMACDSACCHNRATFIECTASTCHVKESACQNRRLQKQQHKKVDVFYLEGKGYGIRAKQPLEQGDIILEYVGEVIDANEYERRQKVYAARGQKHFYVHELAPGVMVDATEKGGFSRFINHSCMPNCRMEKWQVGKKYRLGLVAMRDIIVDEELTYDYACDDTGTVPQECRCGTAKCRGWIGKKDGQKVIVKRAVSKEPLIEEDEGPQFLADMMSCIQTRADPKSLFMQYLEKMESSIGVESTAFWIRFGYDGGMKAFAKWFRHFEEHQWPDEFPLRLLKVVDKMPLETKTPVRTSSFVMSVDITDRNRKNSDFSGLWKSIYDRWDNVEHDFILEQIGEVEQQPYRPLWQPPVHDPYRKIEYDPARDKYQKLSRHDWWQYTQLEPIDRRTRRDSTVSSLSEDVADKLDSMLLTRSKSDSSRRQCDSAASSIIDGSSKSIRKRRGSTSSVVTGASSKQTLPSTRNSDLERNPRKKRRNSLSDAVATDSSSDSEYTDSSGPVTDRRSYRHKAPHKTNFDESNIGMDIDKVSPSDTSNVGSSVINAHSTESNSQLHIDPSSELPPHSSISDTQASDIRPGWTASSYKPVGDFYRPRDRHTEPSYHRHYLDVRTHPYRRPEQQAPPPPPPPPRPPSPATGPDTPNTLQLYDIKDSTISDELRTSLKKAQNWDKDSDEAGNSIWRNRYTNELLSFEPYYDYSVSSQIPGKPLAVVREEEEREGYEKRLIDLHFKKRKEELRRYDEEQRRRAEEEQRRREMMKREEKARREAEARAAREKAEAEERADREKKVEQKRVFEEKLSKIVAHPAMKAVRARMAETGVSRIEQLKIRNTPVTTLDAVVRRKLSDDLRDPGPWYSTSSAKAVINAICRELSRYYEPRFGSKFYHRYLGECCKMVAEKVDRYHHKMDGKRQNRTGRSAFHLTRRLEALMEQNVLEFFDKAQRRIEELRGGSGGCLF